MVIECGVGAEINLLSSSLTHGILDLEKKASMEESIGFHGEKM